MKAEAGTEVYLFLVYALQTPAPANAEAAAKLDPLFTSPWANLLLSIIGLVVVIVGMHFLLGGSYSWREHRTGLWVLVLGKDRRLCTSKAQLMLWTFAIVLALLLLLCFGKDFRALELQPEYLFLLGSPAATALLAKTMTSTKISNGTTEDTEAEEPSVKDVVTDDDGNTDSSTSSTFCLTSCCLLWRWLAPLATPPALRTTPTSCRRFRSRL